MSTKGQTPTALDVLAGSGNSTADEAFLIVQRANREMRKYKSRESRRLTRSQVLAFAERHDLGCMSDADLRCLISDAASLHLTSPNTKTTDAEATP